MRELTIAGRRIADNEPTFVIAEIGHNHQGSVATCMELIRQAKACGADAVKLQKRDNRTLYPPVVYDRPYESEHSFGRTYGEHREALEFDFAQYQQLKAYAESIGIIFFATAFDIPSVDFLVDLGVPAIKIASFDVRSLDLIKYAAKTDLPLVISTGTASEDDVLAVFQALDWMHPESYVDGVPVFGDKGTKVYQYALLHGTSEYPALPEHLNLSAITSMRARYPLNVIGYSNHFSGISMPLVAHVLGARIIEVHFTLNRAMKGSDHAWSLEPAGLTRLVRDIRRAEVAMGDGVKRPIAEEIPALTKAGKPLPEALADMLPF